MTATTYAKRPWSAAELGVLKRDLDTHEPVRTLIYIAPVVRKRVRIDLDIEPETLADVLGISVDDLYRFEDDPDLLSDESNASYRRLIAASGGFGDVLRAPSRLGFWPEADVKRWQRESAKHVPQNPMKQSDRDTHEVG